jgi:RNA polymerase sigma factor for flagellar operon FliA
LPRYDGSTAVQTFAAMRIKGAMIDECREANVMPRKVQVRLGRILAAERALAQQLGRKPTEAEIEAACQMTRSEFLDAQAFRTATHHVSVLTTFKSSEVDGVDAPKVTDPKSPAPTLGVDRLSLLRQTLRGLSKRERLIILGYYFEEHTMKQIGQDLDLSESRVSQMHSQMIEQLRESHRRRSPELFDLARAS